MEHGTEHGLLNGDADDEAEEDEEEDDWSTIFSEDWEDSEDEKLEVRRRVVGSGNN